ncbi:hypothetical protein Tco_0874680 [Tanacetum coccineum]|uniref:Retrotransposon gag domain-containing protein n=1 Tax=Tanacetum coccineum TaxID=301880 RepID=A0ABQ5BRI7_9ASTR
MEGNQTMPFFKNPHKPVILALARTDPKKNLTTFVKAFKECRSFKRAYLSCMFSISYFFGRTNQAGDRFAYHGFEHRMRKLKMPVFEGEDAYGWIYRVERYFEIQGLPQLEQLRAATLCMEGEALSWYRWSEGRTPFHLWDGFKRRLLIRFQQ